MSLIKKYRHVREIIASDAISLPTWDVLIMLDMLERTPRLDAEDRYIESMNSQVDRTIAASVSKVLAAIEAEQNAKREAENKSDDSSKPPASTPPPAEVEKPAKVATSPNGKAKM